MQGRAEPLARGFLQAPLQLTLAAPVLGGTQCSAVGDGRTVQRQLLCSPMNLLTPQSHPKTCFPLFLAWLALLMGVGAALGGGGGCKNLGLILLEVL